MNGGAISGAPYLLWTWVFSRAGLKKLTSRELLWEKAPMKTSQQKTTEACTKKSKLLIFTNLCSLYLSIAAIIFIVISMNTQDYERNLHEPCNPTFVYAILLSILILILGFSIVSLIKNRFKLVAGLSTVCAVATTAAMIEGSILSGYYLNGYYHRIIYDNADILEIYNTIWISFVFLIFLVTVIPVIINTIKTFTQVRYHSIAYRESCYKRVSKMKDYLDQGIITEEEFTKNKQEILKNIKM